MARKTVEARQSFESGEDMARQGGQFSLVKGPITADLQETNARCVYIAQALESVADGLASLADAIKDVYDKLEVIDRKVS